MSDIIDVPAAEVRSWARNKGLTVGTRGHLPADVVGRFNRAHRARRFVDTHPTRGARQA